MRSQNRIRLAENGFVPRYCRILEVIGIRLIALVFVILGIFCSCSSNEVEFKLTGEFQNLEGSILLLKQGDKEYDRDTVKNGAFLLEAKLIDHEFYSVFILGTVPKGGKIWDKPAKNFVDSRIFFVEKGAAYKWLAKGHDDFFSNKDTVTSTSKDQQDYDLLQRLQNKHFERIRVKKGELALKANAYLNKGDLEHYKLYSDSSVLMSTDPPSVRNVINKFLDENPNSYTTVYTLATSRSLKKDLPFFESVYARLSPELKKDRYAREYRDKADQMKKLLSDEKLKIEINGQDKQGRFFDLKNYSAYRLIYIDVWASWCIPCIEQMPAARRMQRDLAGQGVAYIFLSIDGKGTWKAWEKSNTSLELNNSYLLDSAISIAFQNQLAVQTIPRYVIINTKGELLEKEAPGPGEPEKLKDMVSMLIRHVNDFQR